LATGVARGAGGPALGIFRHGVFALIDRWITDGVAIAENGRITVLYVDALLCGEDLCPVILLLDGPGGFAVFESAGRDERAA
jgi:hypothetical protein